MFFEVGDPGNSFTDRVDHEAFIARHSSSDQDDLGIYDHE
jgi:hypothetical protein